MASSPVAGKISGLMFTAGWSSDSTGDDPAKGYPTPPAELVSVDGPDVTVRCRVVAGAGDVTQLEVIIYGPAGQDSVTTAVTGTFGLGDGFQRLFTVTWGFDDDPVKVYIDGTLAVTYGGPVQVPMTGFSELKVCKQVDLSGIHFVGQIGNIALFDKTLNAANEIASVFAVASDDVAESAPYRVERIQRYIQASGLCRGPLWYTVFPTEYA